MSGRTFGFECEVSGGTRAVAEHLVGMGLLPDASIHEYHCSCSTCDPHHGSPIHVQADCTVDGEFITKVLKHGSEEADTVISGLALALRKAKARVTMQGGFHVHVGMADLDAAAKTRLWRLYLHYQDSLAELASAGFDRVRSYNGPVPVERFERRVIRADRYNYATRRWDRNTTERPDFWRGDAAIIGATLDQGSRGEWLWQTSYDTFEFRLWNSTLAEWRMRLAVGMSVALVDAAAAGVSVTPRTRRPIEAVVGRFMDDDTWSGVLRQRFSKGGMAA